MKRYEKYVLMAIGLIILAFAAFNLYEKGKPSTERVPFIRFRSGDNFFMVAVAEYKEFCGKDRQDTVAIAGMEGSILFKGTCAEMRAAIVDTIAAPVKVR